MTSLIETHRDVSLVSKSELLGLNNVIDVLILTDRILRARAILARLRCLWEDLGSEAGVVSEKLGCVDARDRVDRNVGSLVFETTMHVNTCINAPNSSTETLNCAELVPLR